MKKERILSIDGEEVARFPIRETKTVNIVDDDGDFFKKLPGAEMELHIGNKSYVATISRAEYQRMIDDGVMK